MTQLVKVMLKTVTHWLPYIKTFHRSAAFITLHRKIKLVVKVCVDDKETGDCR